MSLYRITAEKFEPVQRTTFAAESLLERRDIQRLLRQDIAPIGDDLLIIAEEYGEWEDSNRRIDLLCLSRSGELVVVEIKRTENGGHMELQAIRYAAMVSSLTLEQIIEIYARISASEEVARNEILSFLQLDSADEAELTGEVRIVLVAADFSTELTTAVLWLNQRDLDITCIRLRPYRMGNEILIDATQIIPLPEATDYEVKIRAQEKEKRKVLGARQQIFRKFWAQLIERSRERTQLFANRSTTTDHWLSAGIGRRGFGLNFSLVQNQGQVECYIRLPGGEEQSNAAFNALRDNKEKIEKDFGAALDWQDLPGRQGCRICFELQGGWKSPESEWPDMQERMIDAMIRLERALKRPIQDLKV